MTEKMPALLPCPFCGGEASRQRDQCVFAGQDYGKRYPVGVRTQAHGFQIRCGRCGMQTCWWHYEAEANAAWNRRASQAVAAVAEDAGRLDWLGSLEGVNLISDDGGKWAVSSSGFQPVPQEGGFTESVAITSFVEPEEWHDTIRAAIDAAMKEDDRAE